MPVDPIPPPPQNFVPKKGDSTLTYWAHTVQSTADSISVGSRGTYGRDRIYISAVIDALHVVWGSTDVATFKGYLTDANREGMLRLHRADLTPAMDPEQLSRSATHYLNATFHFVERSSGAR